VAADGAITGAAPAVLGTVGILAAEAVEVVHGPEASRADPCR
jgi:hypothetical protein